MLLVLLLPGFSDAGTLYSPAHFAEKLPDTVPIVLVFGAQAIRGISAADHPYVRRYCSVSIFTMKFMLG